MSAAIQFLSLESVTRERVAQLREGPATMFSCGIASVDEMNAGGIAAGEYCVVGARTSNGKSMFGLQWAYNVSKQFPCLFISAEMGKIGLADRVIQHCSEVEESQRHEDEGNSQLFDDVVEFYQGRRPILITHHVRHIHQVVDAISQARQHHGVRFVVVDYLQKLGGPGVSDYERVSHVSNALAAAAVDNEVALVALAQLSRSSVTEAKEFVPKLHHLKASGAIEEDADVINFLAWPWKIDPKHPPSEYQVYGAKNRNRGVRGVGICNLYFDPARQLLSDTQPSRERANYEPSFESYNGSSSPDEF